MASRAAMRRIAVIVTCLLALTGGAPGSASAAGIEALPGCHAHKTRGSTPTALPFTVNFYGDSYSSAYVNPATGSVTFTAALPKAPSLDIGTTGEAIIAPLLLDTNGTRVSGVSYGTDTLGGDSVFCVNWTNSRYQGQAGSERNSFQLLLVQKGSAGDFDIIMNYDKVQWDKGPGATSPAAAVGYANGDGGPGHSLVLPGSRMPGWFLDSNLAHALVENRMPSTQPHGRYVFEVRNPAPQARLSGQVTNMWSAPVADAPVVICAAVQSCTTRLTDSTGHYKAAGLAAGNYTVTANDGPQLTPGPPAHPAAAHINYSGVDTTHNFQLGPPLVPLPPDTTLAPLVFTANGVPGFYFKNVIVLTTRACEGAMVTVTISDSSGQVVLGPRAMPEGPAGTYVLDNTLIPGHGIADIVIEIVCPNGSRKTLRLNAYIDPSGRILDSDGQPVPGATVTLHRSSGVGGPFVPVPDGSTLMSPSNRTNPDLSTATGRYAWDVTPGDWRVRAQKAGCVSAENHARLFAESEILTIPPEVTDLNLRLYCPKTRIRSAARLGASHVRASGGFKLEGAKAQCAFGPPPCSLRVAVRSGAVRLGGARARVRPGRTQPIRARLSRRGRVLLAGRHKLKVKLAIRIKKGATKRKRMVRATLRRP